MSRTVRRLAVDKNYSVNRYKSIFNSKDIHVLKEPCPPFVPQYFWTTVVENGEKRVLVGQIEHSYRDLETNELIFYKEDVWKYIPCKITRNRRVPNPAWNDEVDRNRYDWLQIHAHVYRNGTSRRQRINAIRKQKQADHQVDRARSKALVRKEIDEYFSK